MSHQSSTLKPVNKYILIIPIKEKLKSASGLNLTDQDAKEFRYRKGTVVKEGTEVNTVKEGDVIFYDKSAGFSLFIKENPYTVIQERDVVVVF